MIDRPNSRTIHLRSLKRTTGTGAAQHVRRSSHKSRSAGAELDRYRMIRM